MWSPIYGPYTKYRCHLWRPLHIENSVWVYDEGARGGTDIWYMGIIFEIKTDTIQLHTELSIHFLGRPYNLSELKTKLET